MMQRLSQLEFALLVGAAFGSSACGRPEHLPLDGQLQFLKDGGPASLGYYTWTCQPGSSKTYRKISAGGLACREGS